MPTKKFYVILKQAGEGCDYTIGCATKVILIEVPTDWHRKRVALEVAAALTAENEDATLSRKIPPYLNNDETQMREILIVPAEGTIPLDGARVAVEARRKRQQEEADAAKEERRLQYEALKKEFEGS